MQQECSLLIQETKDYNQEMVEKFDELVAVIWFPMEAS